MEVKQIYSIVNTITDEVLGVTDLALEDLSNIVDVGKAILDVTGVDNYVKSLINHIGKVVFVDKIYKGRFPSIYKTAWEFGSILQKIRTALPEAEENKSWELTHGTTYNQDVFTKPTVTNKFFNGRTTFEVPMSFTDMQIKESFSSPEQINAFYSSIHSAITNTMAIKNEALIMRTVNNFIGETIYAEYGADALASKSTVKAVNLLYLYNAKFTKNLTAENAITDADFVRFATLMIKQYIDYMQTASTLFNINGKENFTSSEDLNIFMLSSFKASADIYLNANTFNSELTALPNAQTVPYWQGSGLSFDFSAMSKIDVNISSDNTKRVTTSGILAVMFDNDALGVTNDNSRVTTHYNAKAEFTNNYYKKDAGYFNDTDENFVVFFVA